MTDAPDNEGIIEDYVRVSNSCDSEGVLMEIIGNRKHNPEKCDTKFILAKFIMDGISYFILGSTQHRSRESIKKEQTPFYRTKRDKKSVASLGTRGYGAKLFPFHIGGNYSFMAQIPETLAFSEKMTDWLGFARINIGNLITKVSKGEDFDPLDYRPIAKDPITSDDHYSPFLTNEAFRKSELYAFIKENGFRSFYVFEKYSHESSINTNFKNLTENLGRIYEGKGVKIYSSVNLNAPLEMNATPSLGLLPSYWAGNLTLQWMLGKKPTDDARFWKSIFRYVNPLTKAVFYGQVDSNGSKDRKFAVRTQALKTEDIPKVWDPDIEVIVACCKDEYIKTLASPLESLSARVYMSIEEDILNDKPKEYGLNTIIRNLPTPTKTRILIKILKESVKDNKDSGLQVTHFKKGTEINEMMAIHQNLKLTLKLASKYFASITPEHLQNSNAYFVADVQNKLLSSFADNKKHMERSMKRKKEGVLYEGQISDLLKAAFPAIEIEGVMHPMKWKDKDSEITAAYDLQGEGIDILGVLNLGDVSPTSEAINQIIMPSSTISVSSKRIWIILQIKDNELSIAKAEKDKFLITRKSLMDKYPSDIFISALVLAKKISYTAPLAMEMMREGILTILEDSQPLGELLEEVLWTELDKYIQIL